MPMLPGDAYFLLIGNTVNFLKKHPLKITGINAPSNAAGSFTLSNRGDSFRPGSKLGTHNWKDTESFNIRPGGVIPGGQNFIAHTILMDNGIANMGLYALPNVGGPDIMLTGTLSGCSFVSIPGVGVLNVAHVSPAGGAGALLRTNLMAANPPPAYVYGVSGQRGLYNSAQREVAIVGIRQGGIWHIFAQKMTRQGANGVFDLRIRSVWEIYPVRRKL